MLNRRELLTMTAGGFVTLVLTPILSACGSDSTSPMSTSTSTNPTTPTCDGAGETSSVTLGHQHTLCVPLADLDNPPGGGASYVTSVTDAHQHQVTLTQADLVAVAQGQTVNVMTSTAAAAGLSGHTHAFAVQKMAAPVQAPPPVTAPY
jgi:hypothetical protein